MIKKTITYKDYDGNERTETHYFNFTKAEVVEMENSIDGGLIEMINRIIEAKNQPEIMAIFKKLILKSYGEKSADGKYFLKEDEDGRLLCNKFKQTEAYSVLFMELSTDADAATKFVNGVIPYVEKQGN